MSETKHTSIVELHGAPANGLESTLKAADLDWQPLEDKVGGMDTGIQMPRKKMLYRSDTREPLGIVGQDYCPSDPKAFLKTQYEFAEFCKGRVSRAGFIGERSRAFAFIHVTDVQISKSNRKVGDPLRAHIYSTDGWDGGTPRKSRLFIERLVCLNGMVSKQIQASLWVSHTKEMETRYDLRWKKFLNEIKVSVISITKEFQKLANTPMSKDDMDAFLVKLIPGESTLSANRRGAIQELFHNGVGIHGQSRWDAYNAVTEYVTHHRTYRSSDATSVETNRFLGVLETDTLAPQALMLLN